MTNDQQHATDTPDTTSTASTAAGTTAPETPAPCTKKDMRIGIIVAIVVVIASIATFAFTWGGGKASAESVENCETQITALKAHQDALKTVKAEADEAVKNADGKTDAAQLKALKAAQAEVDGLGDAPTCPTDGSQQDVDEAIAAIRDYADDLRNATSGLDAAAKALGADAE
ncbi:hypothetical protein [Bifidobacterium stellenboschense]|uniref:Uncharacterized protein n=1 Tax=Bifidobacterium stellenboschense TaxID=762211 RepID=A0A087DIA7_9BIFI|nr:hypothetical protein [Bifidobacterium stellenboschense]KFI95257.1 hypothetical protein BSTEL_1992 [Bifidobacterium stellenboschense]